MILPGVCMEFSVFPFFPPPEELGVCVPTGKTMALWVMEAVELDEVAQLESRSPLLPTPELTHDTALTKDNKHDQLSKHVASRRSGMS